MKDNKLIYIYKEDFTEVAWKIYCDQLDLGMETEEIELEVTNWRALNFGPK